MKKSMLDKAKAIQKQLIDWRRDFHLYPELGFQEYRTSRMLAETLSGLGWKIQTGVAKTGVVAEMGSGSPAVALRADMDALPIQEMNKVPYASRNPGVMHACGHDGHMAMALGTAALLAKEKFPGMVRIIFQPAEEVGDQDGVSGAPLMVKAGVLNGIQLIIATHVEPTSPVGTIRIKAGPSSGGVDSWFGEIIGRGGHGAHPHQTVDPFDITAHVIMALNGIVSRRIDPFEPVVVSIGTLHGGSTENVIPERVVLTGTLRYTESRIQEQVHAEIKRAFELSRSLGGDYQIRIEKGSKPMMNTADAASLIASTAGDLLGIENVLPWKEELGAEDFGSYTELVSGAMFTLGTKGGSSHCHLHNPEFDLDESSLPIGTAVQTESLLRFLKE